jgi:hypothetical protein
VITRAGSTMLVATLEDLTGSVEVVVFPKVLAETANAWADDSVVLVTGRVDHRDEASQLLCEAVHAWDDAVRIGPVAFSAERDRLLRARGPRTGGYGQNGNGNGHGNGTGNGIALPPATADTAIPIVRPRGAAPAAAPAAAAAPPSTVAVGPGETADEAPAPADAVPLRAAPAEAGSIAIRFEEGVAMERLLPAIESVTEAIRNRPGELPVLVSIPVAGATRQVRLADRAEWDERLVDQVRAAAGVPVAVELRPAPFEG